MTKRKRDDGSGAFLDAYRRIRKRMPPPERVMRDERRRAEEEQARREIEEAGRTRDGSSDP
jgi:hypothetical protein